MTKHNIITKADFVKSEIEQWDFDYVDQLFDEGYEPRFVNGVWTWVKRSGTLINACGPNDPSSSSTLTGSSSRLAPTGHKSSARLIRVNRS